MFNIALVLLLSMRGWFSTQLHSVEFLMDRIEDKVWNPVESDLVQTSMGRELKNLR